MSADPHYVGGEGDQPCDCVAHCAPRIHQVVFCHDKLSNGTGVAMEHSVEVVAPSCGGRSGPGDCERGGSTGCHFKVSTATGRFYSIHARCQIGAKCHSYDYNRYVWMMPRNFNAIVGKKRVVFVIMLYPL